MMIWDGDRVLLCQRAHHKSYPYHWCVPGGRIEQGENFKQCAIRELREETGIDLNDPHALESEITYFGTVEAFGGGHFQFYQTKLPSDTTIKLNSESCGYGWFTLEEAIRMSNIVPREVFAKHGVTII